MVKLLKERGFRKFPTTKAVAKKVLKSDSPWTSLGGIPIAGAAVIDTLGTANDGYKRLINRAKIGIAEKRANMKIKKTQKKRIQKKKK